MKLSTFITLLVSIFVVFIFLHIHKRSNVIQLSYRKQKNEQNLKQLVQKKQQLKQQLCALQDKTEIKKYAKQHLGMEKITLKQIKKVTNHEQL